MTARGRPDPHSVDPVDAASLAGRLGVAPGDVGLRTEEPGERRVAHRHDSDLVLVVESGDVVLNLPEIHRSVRLVPGDRLDLPAGTLHEAAVGEGGVAFRVARLDPGGLQDGPFHRPGWAWLAP